MNSVTSWLLNRLSEPSSFAGLALIATSVQSALATGDWKAVAASVCGGLAVVLRDRGAAA